MGNHPADLESKKKSGRKRKGFLERLKPKVWYWTVRSRSDLNDGKLDLLFFPEKDGVRRAIADRIRAFEAIRKFGVLPSSAENAHPARTIDLVAEVDSHPTFAGTAKVMNAFFWELLSMSPISLTEATMAVNRCLEDLHLTRIHGEAAMLALASSEMLSPSVLRQGLREDFVGDFEYLLQRATGHLPTDLDLIALLGALYREACLSFNPDRAQVLGHYFNISLMRFCDTDPNQVGITDRHQMERKRVFSDLEDIARHRILYGVQDYVPLEGVSKDTPEMLPLGVVVRPDDEILVWAELWEREKNKAAPSSEDPLGNMAAIPPETSIHN